MVFAGLFIQRVLHNTLVVLLDDMGIYTQDVCPRLTSSVCRLEHYDVTLIGWYGWIFPGKQLFTFHWSRSQIARMFPT